LFLEPSKKLQVDGALNIFHKVSMRNVISSNSNDKVLPKIIFF